MRRTTTIIPVSYTHLMTFTEQLEADLHNVFLNPAEFGETINLNGRAMMAVVEAFDVEFDHAEGFRPGVSLEGVALHVAESDAPDEFRSGKMCIRDRPAARPAPDFPEPILRLPAPRCRCSGTDCRPFPLRPDGR